ncbi:hypothetical protein CEUSTIGMA_g8096.t1 [Chlamydomonas eustigma]|uniref:Uncharacterized protein n=1 Tax=Chlamydomonas eustigma TaxID=1157962 RepID=A0A250XC61_9CHLO|nr:hypothetical protein CEUSTIGMA_g8096.t1 [Chlamydomonas eustigma]|eukprot:GAX80661.1 hypothetical protein CEUSTIGMA_g8096.t1 [Chlamydomonas eustigma]
MQRFLRTNIHPSIAVEESFCSFKHRYQVKRPYCREQTTVAVVMLRNPYDWAIAMHKACYCRRTLALDNELAKLSFHTFITGDWGNDTLFNISIQSSPRPRPTLIGNVPACSHLLHCRSLKLLNFLNLTSWVPFVEYVRHEDVIAPAQAVTWLHQFVKKFRLPLASSGRNHSVHSADPVVLYKASGHIEFDLETHQSSSIWFNGERIISAGHLPLRVDNNISSSYSSSIVNIVKKISGSADNDETRVVQQQRQGAGDASELSLSVDEMGQYIHLINQLLNRNVEAMAGYPVIELAGRGGVQSINATLQRTTTRFSYPPPPRPTRPHHHHLSALQSHENHDDSQVHSQVHSQLSQQQDRWLIEQRLALDGPGSSNSTNSSRRLSPKKRWEAVARAKKQQKLAALAALGMKQEGHGLLGSSLVSSTLPSSSIRNNNGSYDSGGLTATASTYSAYSATTATGGRAATGTTGYTGTTTTSAQLLKGKIIRIAVIGERHSGTTFIGRLLRINIDPDISISEYLCGTFKHRYMYKKSTCRDLDRTLVVIMLRNPYDWASSMHRKCYCSRSKEVEEKVALLPFQTFLEMPWFNDTYFNASFVVGRDTMPLGPWPPCPNLMQCRALKYRNFLNVSTWAPHVELVRHEDVISPDLAVAWLSKIIPKYSLESAGIDGKLDAVSSYKDSGMAFNLELVSSRSVWFSQYTLFSNQSRIMESSSSNGTNNSTLLAVDSNDVATRILGFQVPSSLGGLGGVATVIGGLSSPCSEAVINSAHRDDKSLPLACASESLSKSHSEAASLLGFDGVVINHTNENQNLRRRRRAGHDGTRGRLSTLHGRIDANAMKMQARIVNTVMDVELERIIGYTAVNTIE